MFDQVHAPGQPLKGLLNSDDITTAAAVTLYDIQTQATITLAAGQVFVIYLISVCNGDSASILTVFDDANGDGTVDAAEPLFKKSMNAKEQAGLAYTRGIAVKRAPKVKASAASANSSIQIFGDLQK